MNTSPITRATNKPTIKSVPMSLRSVPINWTKAQADLLTYKQFDYWYTGKMSFRSLKSIILLVTDYLIDLTGHIVTFTIYSDYVQFRLY